MNCIEQHSKTSVALLMAVLIAALIVVRPLLNAIIAAIILSYISHPVYRQLNSRIKKESLSAMLVTASIILLLIVPSVFVLNALSREVFTGYITLKQHIAAGGGEDCIISPACIAGNALDAVNAGPQVRSFLQDNLGRASAYIFNRISNTILSLPIFALHLFIIFFVTYYLLKDGRSFVRKVKYILPVKKAHQEEMIDRFNDVTYAVVFGNVIVALIQGVLAALGFFLFGVQSPLLWGAVTAFVAMVPLIGPFVVWAPLSLLTLANGYVNGETGMVLRGLGLLAYGIMVISSVDNVLKPKIISSKAQVHPALVLLGVIGGLSAFGVVGIILGPVLLSLADTAIDMLGREKKASLLRQ